MARMFGTDGMRGLANAAPLLPETALALGRAVVHALAPDAGGGRACFVVGQDTRLSGSMLEAALTAGICSAGADVLSVGVLPTAGVAYLTRWLGATGGLMISASHNPYMDNGIKVFSARGTKLDDSLEETVEALMTNGVHIARPVGTGIGRLRTYPHAAARYGEFLKLTLQQPLRLPCRIGLDCANGAASSIAPALFTQLGATVRVWHAQPDGCNINTQCGATSPDFLRRKVIDERLDMGFAFDGDADRVIAIDHTGTVLDGDYVLAMCAQELLAADASSPAVVVSTVMANLGLGQALRRMGLTLHQTPVGDKYVVQGMRQTGAILGGEQSGHIVFWHRHTTGDGLLTAIQLLNAVTRSHTALADLAHTLRKYPQVLMNVPIRERRDPLEYPQVSRVVAEAAASLGDEGRVMVRLSGTEAVARVMVEGPDDTVIHALGQRIVEAIAREVSPS